jgi:hypothetical protein
MCLKKILYLLIIFCTLCAVQSCKEVGPDIDLHGNNTVSDTTYVESPVASPETKNVLIEYFTGVECPNCPQGDQIVATIKTQYPGQIAAIAYHPINFLGTAYPFSKQDLQNQTSQTVFDYLVQVGFEPAGAVDRQLFSGENSILLDKSYWAGFATQEIAVATPVNVLLSKTYDSINRQLTIVVELHYTQTVTQANDLTIALTENNIVTAQLNGSVIDTNFIHNDVLRAIVTNATGTPITQTLVAGRVVRNVYQTMLDAAWNASNMNILAFVHGPASPKTVLQVKEISVSN